MKKTISFYHTRYIAITILLLFYLTESMFSQNVQIALSCKRVYTKSNRIVPIDITVKMPMKTVLYNFSEFTELNSDYDTLLLAKILNGNVFHMYELSDKAQWGNSKSLFNNFCCAISYDAYRPCLENNKRRITKCNIYEKLYENRLIAGETDTIINKHVYIKIPDGIKGTFQMYFIYGQTDFGNQFFEKDTLKNKCTTIFKGLVFSNTIKITVK